MNGDKSTAMELTRRAGMMLGALILLGCEPPQVVADIKIQPQEMSNPKDTSNFEEETDEKSAIDDSESETALIPEDTPRTNNDSDSQNNQWDNNNGENDNNFEFDSDNSTSEPIYDESSMCGNLVYYGNLSILNQAFWDERLPENYTHVKGDVLIQDTSGEFNITRLSKLRYLQCIDGNLTISGLPSLEDLYDLSRLGFIGGNLKIIGNESLRDIRGLWSWSVNVKPAMGRPEIIIGWNPFLPNCQAHELYNNILLYETTWEGGDVCIKENLDDECEDIGECQF